MLSMFDQPMNLTRYHRLPHLNLESKISSTLYSSWSLMVTGLGCGGCRCSAISSGDVGADTGDGYDRVDVFLSCREAEFDGSRSDDFGDGQTTSPLVVRLLHWV